MGNGGRDGGIYCPIQQYVVSKPIKWRLKIYALLHVETRFIYNFDINCGKNKGKPSVKVPRRGEPQIGPKVVKQMIKGLKKLRACGSNLQLFHLHSFVHKITKRMGSMPQGQLGLTR